MANMGLPSFFKVLGHDFKSILRIPPPFTNTFEQILPERALLETKSGATWPVKMEHVDDSYCFADGWPKFVKDLALKKDDFLVFRLMLPVNSIFTVAIYDGITGCEKDLTSATTTTSHGPKRRSKRSHNTTKGNQKLSNSMATNQRAKKRSHQTANKLVENPPHFFKVVLSPVGQGIRIPTAFMRQYGESLEKVVWLKVPTGASWPVALLQTDVGTWLRKGWREFAEYYTVEKSHFLVFRYEGNSQFCVIIFDPTAAEIEYPVEAGKEQGIHDNDSDQLPGRRTNRAQIFDEIESDDESIEILEEIPAAASSSHANNRRKSARVDGDKPPVRVKKENI